MKIQVDLRRLTKFEFLLIQSWPGTCSFKQHSYCYIILTHNFNYISIPFHAKQNHIDLKGHAC